MKLLQPRPSRWLPPTPSGRQMMVYAEKLIGLRSEMMAVVGDRSAMRGVLRLGVAETIVHTWLTQLDQERQPRLSEPRRWRSRSTSRRTCATRLLAQEIELAFVVGPLSALERPATACSCDYPVGFLASPSLGLGNGSADACTTWRSFRSSPSRARPGLTRSCARCSTGRTCRRSGCTPAPRWRTVIHMAIEGLGIAVIPTAIVENELADGRLQLLSNRSADTAADVFGELARPPPTSVAVERVAELAGNRCAGRPRC